MIRRISPTRFILFKVLSALLFSSLALAQTVSMNFQYEISALAPRDGVVEEVKAGSALSQIVDQKVIEILNTETGRVFCKVTANNPYWIKRIFLVNEENIKHVQSACKDSFGLQVVQTIYPKRFFIVWTKQDNYPVDGWTSFRNETLIILNKSSDWENRLTQSIIHELAVALDKKEQLGFGGGLLDRSLFGLVSDQQSCLTQALVRKASIKYTLSGMRAFDVEARIVRELKMSVPEGFAQWENLSCLDKFKFLKVYTEPLANTFAPEELANRFMDVNTCSPLVSDLNDEERIELLSQLTLNFEDGSSQNACDFLSKGWPFYPGLSMRGGPGPRIGGSGWQQLSIKSKSQKPADKKPTIVFGPNSITIRKEPYVQPTIDDPQKTKSPF